MQMRPDGKACYVSFDTTYLPTAVRWMARTGEEDACGFALPNTGNHKGRAYAVEHGLRKVLPPHGTIELKYRIAFLNEEQPLHVYGCLGGAHKSSLSLGAQQKPFLLQDCKRLSDCQMADSELLRQTSLRRKFISKSDLLNLDEGSDVFMLSALSYDQSGRVIEWTKIYDNTERIVFYASTI